MFWKIWKLRNNLIFNSVMINFECDVDYVVVEVCDWLKKIVMNCCFYFYFMKNLDFFYGNVL